VAEPKNKKFVFLILSILIISSIISWIAVYDLSQPQLLEVTFFDIGQGDAIFIESPKRHQILIDGGPSPVILEKLGKEMPFWDRSLDLIILTHPEHDHIRGLIEVLKSYKVENILWTGVKRDTSEYEEWLRLIRAKAGQKIILSGRLLDKKYFEQIGLMEIFYPFESLEGKEVKNTNNTSIIAKLIFNENSFLFTGDAYKSVEKKLVKKELNLDSDVLKVGHHGSKTSSGKEFIEKVSPEIVVISVGKENRYGHPHQETLAILNKYDIKILRTDEQGDIKIISDGTNLLIK